MEAAMALQPEMVIDLGMITFTVKPPDVWYMVAMEKSNGVHRCRCGIESMTPKMSCCNNTCKCYQTGKGCLACHCLDCVNPTPITDQDVAAEKRAPGCVVTTRQFSRNWIGRHVVLAGTAVYNNVSFPATLTGRLVTLAWREKGQVRLGLQPISVGSQSTVIQQALQDARSNIPTVDTTIGPILVSMFSVTIRNRQLSSAMASGLCASFECPLLEDKLDPVTFTITGTHEKHGGWNANIITNILLFHDIGRQHPAELKISNLVDNRKYVIATQNATFCSTEDEYVVDEAVVTNVTNAYMDELDGIWDYGTKGILCNHGALSLLLAKDNFCAQNTFNLFIPMSQNIALYEPFLSFMYR